MQYLEENNDFQLQLDDLTKGINRIRYLKQKINNSFNAIKSFDTNQTIKSTQNNCKISLLERKSFSKQKKRNDFTSDSERFKQTDSKKNKFAKKAKQNNFTESSILQNQWDNSQIFRTSRNFYTKAYTDHSKMTTFYRDDLIQNIDTTKGVKIKDHDWIKDINKKQKEEISLLQLKRQNYEYMKKQKIQMKNKIQSKRQKRKLDLQKIKQNVLVHKHFTRKKVNVFVLQKLQEIHNRKQAEKSIRQKKIVQNIIEQDRLQKWEADRLTLLQNAIIMKENMRKILEARMTNNINRGENQIGQKIELQSHDTA